MDPRDAGIFYIGHTSRFDLRCAQHAKGGESIAGLRVRQIAAAGGNPVFIKLEKCDGKRAAMMAEIFWIELFLCRGATLANAQAFAGYEARAVVKDRARDELRFGQRLDYVERLADGRPLREGRPWSKKEKAMVRRLQREGKNRFQIADVVERSVGEIERILKRN